jgi:hypothetical protein
MTGSEPRRCPFNSRATFEYGAYLAAVDIFDNPSSPRTKQSLAFQQQKSLANRRATNAKPLTQFFFE